MLKQQFIDKVSDLNKLNDLLRIDLQNLELCRRKAAISPMTYDYMPFIYNCVTLNELYRTLMPTVIDIDAYKNTVLQHCHWVLVSIGKAAQGDANTTYTRLKEYIALRKYMIEQMVNVTKKEDQL